MKHFNDYHRWEVLPRLPGEGNSAVIFLQPLLKGINITEVISNP